MANGDAIISTYAKAKQYKAKAGKPFIGWQQMSTHFQCDVHIEMDGSPMHFGSSMNSSAVEIPVQIAQATAAKYVPHRKTTEHTDWKCHSNIQFANTSSPKRTPSTDLRMEVMWMKGRFNVASNGIKQKLTTDGRGKWGGGTANESVGQQHKGRRSQGSDDMPVLVEINNLPGCGRRTNEENEKEAGNEDLHKDEWKAKIGIQTMWAQTPHGGGRTKATNNKGLENAGDHNLPFSEFLHRLVRAQWHH